MSVWSEVDGTNLAQGDLITRILVPSVRADFPSDQAIDAIEIDALIATQSCDLENDKIPSAVVVRTMRITEFEQVNDHYKRNRKNWNIVLRGGVHALYMLPSEDGDDSEDRRWIVDFREIYSLPVPYLRRYATELGKRARLCSPYTEHFSQAFARFFMRVALPENMPDFR